MEKDTLSANSSGSLGEFNRRGVSSIFSSLRPKKDKKSKKRYVTLLNDNKKSNQIFKAN